MKTLCLNQEKSTHSIPGARWRLILTVALACPLHSAALGSGTWLVAPKMDGLSG